VKEFKKASGFVPATTEKEAKARLNALLTKGMRDELYLKSPGMRYTHQKGMALGKVPKMSLELQNAMLERMEQFEIRCKNLGIPMLRGTEGANKYAMSMGDGVLGINTKYQEGNIARTTEKQLESHRASIENFNKFKATTESKLAQLEKDIKRGNTEFSGIDLEWAARYKAQLLRDLKNQNDSLAYYEKKIAALESKDFDWWAIYPGKKPSVSSELYRGGKEKVWSDLDHEFAHHIHDKLDVNRAYAYREKTPLEQRIENIKGKTYPTTYSAKNSKEWFAENYSLYMNGQEKAVDPAALSLVKEIAKRQDGLT
jgi:hypothetical protein